MDVSHPISWDDDMSEGTHDWGPHYVMYSPSFERIVDVKERTFLDVGSHRVQQFKPVAHLKLTCELGDKVTFRTDSHHQESAKGGVFLDAGFAHSEPSYHADMSFHTLNLGLAKVQGVSYGSQSRWEVAKPSLATRAGLAVFLYELRDLKRMFEVLPGKHFSVRDWRSVLKYANDQHLNYNFGWKPFLRDIRNVLEGMRTLDERMAKFMASASMELHRRVGDAPLVVSGLETGPNTVNTFFTYELIWNLVVERASSFDFYYTLPEYGQRELRWRALLDTLGLNANPSTIWAVMPWSFVVDWFYNVSSVLKATETDWVAPWITIHQACYSRKVSGSVELHVRTPADYRGYKQLPGFTVRFSQYDRCVGMPVNSGITGPLDADKIRLGSSLLLSRIL